jgi:type II secretory pathway pseudopilin PulG
MNCRNTLGFTPPNQAPGETNRQNSQPPGNNADNKLLLPAAGFTLVETVITLGLFVMVSLALMFMLDGFGKIFYSQQALLNAAGSARQAMTAISNSTVQAANVLATSTIAGTLYTSSATTTILLLPAVDNTGNVAANKYDTVIFYASSGKLYEIQQPDVSSSRLAFAKTLSDTLANISFTYNNSNFLQVSQLTVDLQTRSIVHGQTLQAHLAETLNLKNH